MSWYATEERTGVLLVTVWTVAPLRASLKDGVVPGHERNLEGRQPGRGVHGLDVASLRDGQAPRGLQHGHEFHFVLRASPFGMYMGVGLPLRPMGVFEYGAFVGCERWLQYRASWVMVGLTPLLNQEM